MNNLPNGWQAYKLGDFMEFKNGLNFNKSNNGEKIKIVGVSDFQNLSELHSTNNLDVINVSNKLNDDYLLKNEDLLFVRSNGNKNLIGRCLYFPNVQERVSFSGFTIRGRVDKNFALPLYVASFARSNIMKRQIRRNGGGTNISNLSQQILNDINLNLPPLPEQEKIAEILTTWDKAINTAEKLLINSEQQKKALMQQLLTGKKRLKDESGKVFCGDWTICYVEDILNVRNEKQVPTQDVPLYSLTIEKGITPKSARYNREFLVKNTDSKKYKLVKSKDIVYNPANLRWGAINFSNLKYSVVVSPIYEVLYIKNEHINNFKFIAYKLMSSNQINKFASMVEGTLSERMAVKIKPFLKTKLTLPPTLEEQQAIAQVLTTADQQIDNLKQQISKLKQEKKALMQVLLSGKVRVNVEDF